MPLNLDKILKKTPLAEPPKLIPQKVEEPEDAELARFRQLEARAKSDINRHCRNSFRFFVAYFWDIVNPTRKLQPSYAVDVISDALQSTIDGDVKQLAVACPPGVSKSKLCAILYPAWILLRTDGKARIMVGSYSWSFAERDSTICRDLVTHPLYQAVVGGTWSIRTDRSSVSDWWTTVGGRRLITSIDGKSTGERVDYQIIDDPLSAADRLSDAARKEAARWVSEVLPSRMDDVDEFHKAVRVIVHQRLAIDDPIGVLLTNDPDGTEWAYCRLPALLKEGEAPTERWTKDRSKRLWFDSRKPGEPLFAGLSASKLAQLAHPSAMGTSQVAVQYFQNPVDDAGSIIKRFWWRFYYPSHVSPLAARPNGSDTTPATPMPESFERIVIACDLTLGSITGDYAVVQAWGCRGAGRYLLDQWRKKAGLLDSVSAIKSFKVRWPQAKVIVEKAAHGNGAIEELAAAGMPGVIGVPAVGSKKERIGLVAATIESACCFLPLGSPWLADYVEELAGATKHDDQQDATAYGVHELNKDALQEWPEQRAERERKERIANGEILPEPPSLDAKVMNFWLGIPLTGQVKNVETGQINSSPCAIGHTWYDGGCIVCGHVPR